MQFHKDNTIPPRGWIWVFGSNRAGRHGLGAAKVAHVNFGARYGVGEGRTGDAYAIPTKNRRLEVLPLCVVEGSVAGFLEYARTNGKEQFFVTKVGCGYAGHTDAEIAPFFRGAPPNCSFAEEWKPYLS